MCLQLFIYVCRLQHKMLLMLHGVTATTTATATASPTVATFFGTFMQL